jgi:ATP-dependent helicase HrpB
LTEPGLGGRETDLRERLRAFDRDHSPRAEDARKLADRWARSARAETRLPPLSDAGLIGEAWPDRIAKARSGRGEFQLASGRGAFLDETDALARVPWLAVAELGGGGARDRILLAAPLDEAEVRIAFAHRLTREDRLERSAAGRLRAFQGLMLGRLMVEERLIERPDPELISAALLAEVRKAGLKSLDLGEATTALRIRVGFLRAEDQDGWPDFSDAALIGELEDWLAPLLIGAASLASLSDAQIEAALRGRLSWEAQQRLDRLAPARWEAPTGSRLTVDYAAEGGPRIEVRVQELFGLSEHPTIGPGRTPLILALLSPARRPIQITRDLPAFWRGSWRDVKAEMRGRYPRHPWPDDPAAAAPTTRVKPRG